MSYTPTDWKTGDVITAEKLNNIEQGVVASNSPILVKAITDSLGDVTLDKTFREIATAYYAGKNVIIESIEYPPSDEYLFFENVCGVSENTSDPQALMYRLYASQSPNGWFVATNENDYPKWADKD